MTFDGTEFAPADKADPESVLLAAQLFRTSGLVYHVTNALPSIVLILNSQRQVVFKNQRLMELLGVSSDFEVLGKRPGDLLDCIHAHDSTGGCGTTEFCSECGAVKAVLETQDQGITTVKECRILSRQGEVHDFRVWASPYNYQDTEFTILSLTDISDQKRRHILEKTFFHDMNNILSIIVGRADFLDDDEVPEDLAESVASIRLASHQLLEEVLSHRKLLSAEKGNLAVDLSRFDSLALIDEVLQLFSGNSTWRGRSLVVEDGAEDFEIVSDRALLRRVICNMVKNALEASAAGDEVRLGCSKDDSEGVFHVHNLEFMPRPVQLQVFKRSFSTKGKGRGIGTYSMKLFGEKYLKGRVWFSTSENEGTTFFVSVPHMSTGIK